MDESPTRTVRLFAQRGINLPHFSVATVAKEFADLQDVQIKQHEDVVVSLRLVAQHRWLFVPAEQRTQGVGFPEPELLAIGQRNLRASCAGRQHALMRLGIFDRNRGQKDFLWIKGPLLEALPQVGDKIGDVEKRVGRFLHAQKLARSAARKQPRNSGSSFPRYLARRFRTHCDAGARISCSAGLQTCCIADFQIGTASDRPQVSKPAIQQTWKSAPRFDTRARAPEEFSLLPLESSFPTTSAHVRQN